MNKYLSKKYWWLALVSFVSGWLFWQYFGGGGFLPVPSEIFYCLWQKSVTGELFIHLRVSMFRFGIGLAIGWSLGVLLGISMALSKKLFYVLIPWLILLFPVPKIALFPLFMAWLGIGEESRILTIALGVLMPSVVCSWLGVRSVPVALIDLGRYFSLPFHIVIRSIILPGILPYLLLSLRISVILGLILLVSSEMLGAQLGLGVFILFSGSVGMLDQLFAGVLLISTVGILFFMLISFLEYRFVHWKKTIPMIV